MDGKLVAIKDAKKEIEFWLKALDNPNITMKNIELLNKCLEMELNSYLYQFVVNKRK